MIRVRLCHARQDIYPKITSFSRQTCRRREWLWQKFTHITQLPTKSRQNTETFIIITTIAKTASVYYHEIRFKAQG
jgi:hypothetical protein